MGRGEATDSGHLGTGGAAFSCWVPLPGMSHVTGPAREVKHLPPSMNDETPTSWQVPLSPCCGLQRPDV